MSHLSTSPITIFILVLASVAILPQASLAAPDHLIIIEVQISGGPGRTTDDFIELYNPTTSPIDLKGMRLVKRTANSASDTTIKSWVGSTIVPSGGYYLWTNTTYTTIAVKPNATTSQTIANNNAIALRRGPADTGAIIDSLAWGTANNGLGEGSSSPANPLVGQVLARNRDANNIPQDSDRNTEDFNLTQATPQSTPTTTQPATSAPTAKAAQNVSDPRSLNLNDITKANTGELVTTTGLVTKVTKTTFTIQSNGINLRVALRNRELDWPTMVVGTEVEVTGLVAVSRGEVELRPRAPADIVVRAHTPQPETITLTHEVGKQNTGYLILALSVLVLGGAYLWQRYKLTPTELLRRFRNR